MPITILSNADVTTYNQSTHNMGEKESGENKNITDLAWLNSTSYLKIWEIKLCGCLRAVHRMDNAASKNSSQVVTQHDTKAASE